MVASVRHARHDVGDRGRFLGPGAVAGFLPENRHEGQSVPPREYRDVPDWFFKNNHDYRMLDPAGKPVGTQICLQHEGFRRLVDQYLRRAVRVARAKPSLLMYSIYDEFCIRGWDAIARAASRNTASISSHNIRVFRSSTTREVPATAPE